MWTQTNHPNHTDAQPGETKPRKSRLVVDSGLSRPRSFNCNACAASLPVPVSRPGGSGETLQLHAQMVSVELADGNLVAFSPLSQVGAVVLTGAMRSLVEAFRVPGSMDEVQKRLPGFSRLEFNQAVSMLMRCGVLCTAGN
jgi:hypothetical protein